MSRTKAASPSLSGDDSKQPKSVSFSLSRSQNALNKVQEHSTNNYQLSYLFRGGAAPGSRTRKLKGLLKQGRLSSDTYKDLMFSSSANQSNKSEKCASSPTSPVKAASSSSLAADTASPLSEHAAELDPSARMAGDDGEVDPDEGGPSAEASESQGPQGTISILKQKSRASPESIQKVVHTDQKFEQLGERFLAIRKQGAVFVKYTKEGNPELRLIKVGLDNKHGWYITWSRLKSKKDKKHYTKVFQHVIGVGDVAEDDAKEPLERRGSMAHKSASFVSPASCSTRADGKFALAPTKSLSFSAEGNNKKKKPSNNPFRQSFFPSFKLSRKLFLCDILLVRQHVDQLNTFRKFSSNPNAKPWLAFQLVFGGRKLLSLVAGNTEQLKLWFLGLQSLSPLNRYQVPEGQLLWSILRLKLEHYGIQMLREYVQEDGLQVEDNNEELEGMLDVL
jgi:hypothetical protein